MFITEQRLEYLQKTELYRGRLLAYIFINEWIRQGRHKTFIRYEDFSNFFCKWTDNTVEGIFFKDNSGFMIDFKEKVYYVTNHKDNMDWKFNIDL